MNRVLGGIYRVVASSLFYMTCLGWTWLHIRMAHIPSEDWYGDVTFCLLLLSIVAGLLFLPLVLLFPPERFWRPDHYAFVIGSVLIMVGLACILDQDPNPWERHGVKVEWV